MKTQSRLAVLPAVLSTVLLLAGCGLVREMTKPAVNWDFIQSVGGMEIDKPYIDQDLLYIPVTVDFSGSSTLTVPPSHPNTGLQCDWGRAQLQADGPLPFLLFDYDVEVQFHAVAATAQRRRPFTALGTDSCQELIVPLGLPMLIGVLPEPETIHLWYRDSVFVRHYLGEFEL